MGLYCRGRGRDRARGHGGGAAAFAPSSIANLELYLDGDTAPVVSGTIPSWTDLSGKAKHATNATPAQQPAAGAAINGKNTVHYAGGQVLGTPAIALGVFTIYVVGKFSGTAGILYEHSANTNSGNGCFVLGTTGSTMSTERAAQNTAWNKTANWATDGVARVLRHQYDGTHAGHTLAVNGVVQALTAVATQSPGTGTTSQALFLGARSGLVLPVTGDYRRVLVYSRVLSTTEDAQVTAWLRADAGV